MATILSITNGVLGLKVTTLGATIMDLTVKDKNGVERDVVLGYDTTEEYIEKDGYLGALIGRFANRISTSSFTLNGVEYVLSQNDGPNCLHGGKGGFSTREFGFQQDEYKLSFVYESKDGEEGFPGNMTIRSEYILQGNSLIIRYSATTDKDTVVNLTNHSYFNLSGAPCYIGDHVLTMKADKYACINNVGVPTGEFRDVTGTPFDFRAGKRIGDTLETAKNEDGSFVDEQLQLGHGIDHPYVFSAEKDQVSLYCEETGIEMVISSDLPGTQIYSGNFLTERDGKRGSHMVPRDAVCIETQYLPDGIHLEEEPMCILRAGETYHSETSYTFNIK